MSKFVSFLRDESGASAAEYVLILAIMGTAIVTGVGLFGDAIGNALTAAATFLDNNNLPT